MKYWRMRMRNGNGGLDMFEQCLLHGLAAIHYPAVESIDLSRYAEDHLPPEWEHLKSSQSGSLKKLAWRIRGGDTIYVAESYPSRLVGVGRVRGAEDAPAYHYIDQTPVVDDGGHPWRHVLNVEWEEDFEPIPYPEPWAAQATVLDLEPAEIKKIQSLCRAHRAPNTRRHRSGMSPSGGSAEDLIQRRQLEDWAYTRYTGEAIKKIQRRHASLCNEFTSWLGRVFDVPYRIERMNIDLCFRLNGVRLLVEFKIAYTGDPKPAIREALGQILEYNYYPGRKHFDHWILVLNCSPTHADLEFLRRIRRVGLPISYGWPSTRGFDFSPGCPLAGTLPTEG